MFSSFFYTISIFSDQLKPKITFLIAEREYFTEQSLPAFAKEYLLHNHRIFFCEADKEGNGRHILKNADEIKDADLLFVSVRRRTFTEITMNSIRNHIIEGKPVAAIRTASHPFQLRKEVLPTGHQEWTEWDREVIGGNYNGHLGKGLMCKIYPILKNGRHEILDNIRLPFLTPATLYRNSPLPKTSLALLKGVVNGHPQEPVG